MEEGCSGSRDDTSNDADFMYCMGSFLKTGVEKNGTYVPMCEHLAKFCLK